MDNNFDKKNKSYSRVIHVSNGYNAGKGREYLPQRETLCEPFGGRRDVGSKGRCPLGKQFIVITILLSLLTFVL